MQFTKFSVQLFPFAKCSSIRRHVNRTSFGKSIGTSKWLKWVRKDFFVEFFSSFTFKNALLWRWKGFWESSVLAAQSLKNFALLFVMSFRRDGLGWFKRLVTTALSLLFEPSKLARLGALLQNSCKECSDLSHAPSLQKALIASGLKSVDKKKKQLWSNFRSIF